MGDEEDVGKEEQRGGEKMEWEKSSTSFRTVGSGFSIYKVGWARLHVIFWYKMIQKRHWK